MCTTDVYIPNWWPEEFSRDLSAFHDGRVTLRAEYHTKGREEAHRLLLGAGIEVNRSDTFWTPRASDQLTASYGLALFAGMDEIAVLARALQRGRQDFLDLAHR